MSNIIIHIDNIGHILGQSIEELPNHINKYHITEMILQSMLALKQHLRLNH